MSDTDSESKGRGRPGGGPRGPARQSLGGGRTKAVVVEKKRKRIMAPGTSPAPNAATLRRAVTPPPAAPVEEVAPEPVATPEPVAPKPKPAAPVQKKQSGKPNMLRSLSDEEYARRLQALKQAKKDDDVRKKREAEEAAARAARDAKRAADEEAAREAEEAARREAEAKAADEARQNEEEAAALKAKEEAEQQAERAAQAKPDAAPTPPPAVPGRTDREDSDNSGRGRRGPATPPPKKQQTKSRGDDRRRSGKLTIAQATGDSEGGRQRSMAAMRRRQERERRKMMGTTEREKVFREVTVPDAITVQELANRMTERVGDVIKALMKNGIMATQNQLIDQDTSELLVEEFGHKVIRVSEADVEDAIETTDDKSEDLESRAPIITIMGHVDHGKTSLLDALRKTNVVSGEAGGITQHIGAYQIESESGQKLTFLDTPGHAAFTSMRARGAQVTDIVILVVAADDSVMPQTIEAIKHAKAAEVPMIVAINKIDREGADPTKVRTELLQHEVIVEDMSGDVLDVEVSAITGQGLDELVENIALQAELLDLKANPSRPAEGAVIEAKLDVGRGPVATVLVQRGTLRTGDIFVVGEQWGKVRALINDQGDRVKEAGPSEPVEVLGLNGTPEAGDVLNVVEDETKAREISEYRQRKTREKSSATGAGAVTSLDQLLAQAQADENVSKLPVVVKSDVQGSAEAISQALEKIGNDEVSIQLLLSGVGAITESDVNLADASKAPIIGFNVRANAPAREAANQKGVEIRYYSVIYDLVDDVKAAASGLLSPEVKETFIGYAAIKQVFKVTGVGKVAGCEVTEGVAQRSAGVRLLRDNVVIHEGTLKTLKRFKDEVKEVQGGQECGMAFENYDDIRDGDVIEIFTREEIERTL
ncbi:MAG: translation initiation factor IF-2 [Pseudomonadota bacterium]